jgi:hypothetical protein
MSIFEELRRKWKEEDRGKPRLLVRLPDTAQTRRALTQSHDLYRYQSRPCARCGRSFLVRCDGVAYCSRDCQQADRNERRAEKRERERQRHPRKPIKCARAGCGQSVPPERSTRRYCSDACRQAAYRGRKTAD